jgi:hypothetical protein
MDGRTEHIDDPGELASVRSQAKSVGRRALMTALGAAIVVLVLP